MANRNLQKKYVINGMQNYLACLSKEQHKILHNDLVMGGLSFDGRPKHDKEAMKAWKAIFKVRINESSGKRKKIYQALTKAKKHQVDSLLNVMVAVHKTD